MTTAAPPRTLYVIRAAVGAGVVAFAVAAWVVRRNWTPAGFPVGRLGSLRMIAVVAAGIVAAALVTARTRLGTDPRRRNRVTILAWAAGEFAALLGIAVFLVSGIEGTAAPGLLTFALALVLFPVRTGG